MSNTIQAIKLLLIIALVLASVGYYQLGMDYLDPEIGRGLHPLMSFPLMIICILATWPVIIFRR